MGHAFDELSNRVIGVGLEVHTILGPGFIEGIYQNAMEVALLHRGIGFRRQVEVPVSFEDVQVGLHRLDIIVDEKIILELKAIKNFDDVHFAQLRSYLKATGLRIGLLLNFNAPVLAIKRVVL